VLVSSCVMKYVQTFLPRCLFTVKRFRGEPGHVFLQSFAEVLTPWVGWGGVGSAEVADRALRLSRPDVLMASAAPGKARCAELFPPGARHLVTLGNVADRYTHPDDQPDPPETLQ